MDSLPERIEAAERPSRELDWEIFCLHQPERLPYYEEHLAKVKAQAIENGLWELRADAIIEQERSLICPRYTASIDAAMTLVPEGWAWAVAKDLHAPGAHVGLQRKAPYASSESSAATPALALCAAALRAKEQPNEG